MKLTQNYSDVIIIIGKIFGGLLPLIKNTKTKQYKRDTNIVAQDIRYMQDMDKHSKNIVELWLKEKT